MHRFRQLLPWAIALLLLGWSSYGVWPVAPVEGDEQGVLFGVVGMLKNDTVLLHMRYIYELQPGYYHVLIGLTNLTRVAPETLFATLTVIGALAFALAGARLLQLLLHWPLGWSLVAILWCQEITTAAFYMNTSALAGGPAILAVILAYRPQRSAWLAAGLLLAVAGWLRADSLLVAPACLGLAYWRERHWRPAIIQTAAIAVITVVIFLGLYALSGTSVFDSLNSYQQRGFLHTGWRTFGETIPQMLSPALALAALAGLALLLAPTRRPLGVVLICGISASLFAHGTELTTPKYFYYIIPFMLIPALVLIERLGRAVPVRFHYTAGLAAVVLILADSVLGLRTLMPVQRIFLPTPPLATFVQTTWRDKPIALVIGSGEVVFNVDGFRLRTGKWFAPGCWHREKQRVLTDLATIRSWLAPQSADGKRPLTIYWANWLPLQMAARELLASGFRPAERHTKDMGPAAEERWHRDGQVVHLRYLGYAGSTFQAPGPAPASGTGTDTYFIGDSAHRPLTELSDNRGWQRLSAVPEGLLTVYQRR